MNALRPASPRLAARSAGPGGPQPPAPRRRFTTAAWRRWPRETRDTLFQLAVIAWVIAPHLWHLPAWCGALAAVVLAWRAVLALQGGPLPGRWPVIGVLAVAVALTALTEQTLLGREAGVTLLVVLLALKTLELRARRDAVIVFFLGFFLVLTQCLYSQSLAMALAMLVSTWGLLTALVLGNLPVGRPSLLQAGKVAARSALLGLPVMAALFVLFPRFGPLWGLPEDSAGRTGLSGTLRMGGVAELANDDGIAMRVRFEPGRALPPEALYFRGVVLGEFDGLDWQPQVPPRRAGSGRPGALDLIEPSIGYEILLEPSRLAVLPLIEVTPARAGDAPRLADWVLRQGPDLQWHTDRPINEPLRFSARAYPAYRLEATATPGALDALLHLPPGYNPRSLAWAAQLRRQLGPVDARTLAATLMAHIGQGPYVYTLAPGTYGRDAVDEFWLDRREGFCEHYASAFVVLMRAMGVPARLVVGYQGAEAPDPDGWRVVRQSHAHAWAEYWQAGFGWVRADPTVAVAPERVRASRALPPRPGFMEGALKTLNPDLAQRLKLWWERWDSRWTQWVMGWSRTRQLDLLRDLGFEAPTGADLLRVLVGGLALAAAAAAAWAWHDRRRQDPWQKLQQRLCAALARAGVAAGAHDGPRTLAARVRDRHGAAGEAAAAALESLDRHRYGPHAAPGRALPAAADWSRLMRAVRRLPAAAGRP